MLEVISELKESEIIMQDANKLTKFEMCAIFVCVFDIHHLEIKVQPI